MKKLKRKALADQFAGPKTIKPLRAPRMNSVDRLPKDMDALMNALESCRNAVGNKAGNDVLEKELARLRGIINFVRAHRHLSSSRMGPISDGVFAELADELGVRDEREIMRQRRRLDARALERMIAAGTIRRRS